MSSEPYDAGGELNVLGLPLEACSADPLTGFFRTGGCLTGPDEAARHLVCCIMTAEFLVFSQAMGNDLTSARPEQGFAGLHPGDRWCLHVLRWKQAFEAGRAPRVVLLSTNRKALEFVPLEALKRHAMDLS